MTTIVLMTLLYLTLPSIDDVKYCFTPRHTVCGNGVRATLLCEKPLLEDIAKKSIEGHN